MTARADLARSALAAARRVRIASGTPADAPICVFDLIQQHYSDSIDLRFKAVPSLEGLYVRGEDTASLIILSSERPSGRQRLTCAHELGHHEFRHGTRLEELTDASREPEFSADEFLADCFAGFLLMPKLAMMKAFAVRKLSPDAASPLELYRLACAFGVGYSTLVQHSSRSLDLISRAQATTLIKTTPKKIRELLLGEPTAAPLHVVDAEWSGRAVDVHTGDLLLVPTATVVEGDKLSLLARRDNGDLYEAARPGIGRIEHPGVGMSNYVRVARSGYEGRGMFRHEEESDE